MDESQYIKSIKFKHNVNRFDLQVGSTELKISSKIIESRGNIWQDVINGGTCERYCQTVFIIRETEFAVSILSEEEYKTITTLWWFRNEVRRTIVPMGYLKIVSCNPIEIYILFKIIQLVWFWQKWAHNTCALLFSLDSSKIACWLQSVALVYA